MPAANTLPYEIIAGVCDVYVAPVGTDHDWEKLAVGAAQGQLQRALRDLDAFKQLAGLAIDVNLSGRDKDITA